jgi:hypothetical protein
VYNSGTLRITGSIISNNRVSPPSSCIFGCNAGGGIWNTGTLTISYSTVIGNMALTPGSRTGVAGAGVLNSGTLTINNSTINSNSASATGHSAPYSSANGGGIANSGTVLVNNSTITGNTALASGPATGGGGIYNQANLTISNSTLNANRAPRGAGIDTQWGQSAILQDTIVANTGGNCYGGMTSYGYNLSSDSTCSFSDRGDLNDTDPKLGTLGYYGGPTQTIPLLSGSPAIDAGNPTGCTDAVGNLLKTDQRGMPRPDREDKSGCDVGAYESQSD